MRPEATGYGATYFAAKMLATRKMDFKGKMVAVSGAGNVAQYTVEKVNQLGGKVISPCDSTACIIHEAGIDNKKCNYVLELKNVKRGRISEYADKYKAVCYEGKNVWDVIREQGIKVDVALPSATQNEINGKNAAPLVKNGCICVAEGANMPSTPEAIKIFQDKKILYGPGKAANAGGVAGIGPGNQPEQHEICHGRSEEDNQAIDVSAIHNPAIIGPRIVTPSA